VGRFRCNGNRSCVIEPDPCKGMRTNDWFYRKLPPAGRTSNRLEVLLALLDGWGVTLRLVLLICVPITAVVAIVAVMVIYLGPHRC
jgi:hypothetical protein